MLDEHRLNDLLKRMCGNDRVGNSFPKIVAAYSEPHRRYHTGDHIEACLSEFDRIRVACVSPDLVECALWLHDVVYEPLASDNEEKSALWAMEILTKYGCPEKEAIHIGELILITKHIASPASVDAQLIMDIDLSVFGQPSPVFNTYEKNIRAEYYLVPEEEYMSGRARVLRGFLERQSIYFTDRFKERYGVQARANLENALRALGFLR